MSRGILRPSRAQVAALLAVPVLGLGPLAPVAFADAPPPGPRVDSSDVIGRVCQEVNSDPEDRQDVSCERDIAPRLSRLIGPGSGLTCRNSTPTTIVCRKD
ncbi:hypothetical protein [Streptomyces alanosinicus]|uniref:Uncharacterized protein n=1 Tax=Streptomyces alanosinicus TaxID=68171 RepID=A0A918YIG3_9ACTN|nr:hypothetical protein [Streptomyces alanosinicus]GHE04121.1 hypothetical protein GCM10010339_34430 [Streptomyces alanosinicus]